MIIICVIIIMISITTTIIIIMAIMAWGSSPRPGCWCPSGPRGGPPDVIVYV